MTCTASPSRALKNSSQVTSPKKNNNKDHWSHQQGLESELRVIRYYETAGFDLIAQRVKTPFAEVDLLFRTPDNHVLMVEVKTNNISAFQNFRIGKRQKIRLVRALLFLSDRLDSLVEVHWAFVTKEGKVTIIEDISG